MGEAGQLASAGRRLGGGEQRRLGETRVARRVLAALASEASDNPLSKECERSLLINEEIVLLIFQLDLDSQLQRALNYEDFELAQDIRLKRQQVDEALQSLQESKTGSGRASAADTIDLATAGLQLRSELQRAVEEERYADAAALRDRLKEIEDRASSAAALAAEWDAGRGGVRLRLGQRVLHRSLGYRGVVVGWDDVCCESAEWQANAGVPGMSRGPNQTYYHVLVDSRDWPAARSAEAPPVAYVADELLEAPEEPSTWVQVHGDDPFRHPYCYLLFYGTDGAGDFVPCKQLRDKYNAARRDVYTAGEDGSGGADGGGEGDDVDGSGI